MRTHRAIAFGSVAALLSACTTVVRKETTVRVDGRDTKKVEYVTPQRYSETRATSKPFWSRVASKSNMVPTWQELREPLVARRSASEVDEPSGGGLVHDATSYSNIVAVASAPASALEFPRTVSPPAMPSQTIALSTAQIALTDALGRAEESLAKPRFEVRYSRVRLWTDLETTFQSPSFIGLNWNRRPKTVAGGPELAFYPDREDHNFGLRFGMFHGQAVTNTHREGGFYAIEKTRLEAYWGAAEVRHHWNEWLFSELGLGVFFYSLRTDLESNTSAFVYESASVDSLFGAFGVGCGIEAPWNYPLRPFIAAKFWFPFRGEDASFEWGVGQVSGGLNWRFE